jgi:hypothetical protein
MTDMIGADGLTGKKREFLERYKQFDFNPQKRFEALRASGYSQTYARHHGARIERSVKPFIVKAMKKAKIGPTRLASKLSELLDCKNEPNVQLRALDVGLRLLDAYPNPKISSKVEERTVHTDFDTLRMAEEVTGERLLPEYRADDDDNLAPL